MEQQILDLQRQLEMLKSGRSRRSVAPEEEEDLHREERPEGGPTRLYLHQRSCLLQDAALLRVGGSKRQDLTSGRYTDHSKTRRVSPAVVVEHSTITHANVQA